MTYKKELVLNRKASFQYDLKEKFEAGIVLSGSEVKSLREGKAHLKDAYVAFIKNEAFLLKAHISPYNKAFEGGHKPERVRKLLLQKNQLKKIRGWVEQKRMSLIPLSFYLKAHKIKLEIALGIGKTNFDKRQSLKKKQSNRQIERALKKEKM